MKKVTSIGIDDGILDEAKKRCEGNFSTYVEQLIKDDLRERRPVDKNDINSLEVRIKELKDRQTELTNEIETLIHRKWYVKKKEKETLERHLRGLTYTMQTLAEKGGVSPTYFKRWSDRTQLSITQIEKFFKQVNPDGFDFYVRALDMEED